MINSISFKSLSEIGESVVPYELKLPSICGKTIEFKPGINIVIGKNGCGKTSLFNVMRKLTFCQKKLFSFFGYQCEHLELRDCFEQILPFVEMKGDFTKSCYNMRTVFDVDNSNWEESTVNMLQAISGNRRSNYQKHMDAFQMMLSAFVYNSDAKYTGENTKDSKNFDVNVRNKFKKSLESCNDVYQKIYSGILDYYNRNHVDGNEYTFFVDEIDNGVDVDGLYKLMQIFGGSKPLKFPMQIIAVLHNIVLIDKLSEIENVNFIELTDGYLDQAKFFVKHGKYMKV